MARTPRPRYEGDPTLSRVMLRPRWIAALALALAIAAAFAWLGRWQLGHSIRVDHDETAVSETVRPLADVTAPGSPVTDQAAGMVVETRGSFVPGDFLIVDERKNGDRMGAWVTGHFATEGGGHLAVAIGWAPTAADAARALGLLGEDPATTGEALALEGRYMPSDAAIAPGAGQDPMRITTMAPAQLVNRWAPFEGAAYAGFLVMHPTAPVDAGALGGLGLEAIDSVPPLPAETINWLNLFYAVEWIVFAGFAIFFWYRLARDAWEKEHELRALAEAGAQDPALAEE